MNKKFLLIILIFSFVLTAGAAFAKSKILQSVEKITADYFNDKNLRAKYQSEIRSNKDGSYTLSYEDFTMRFLMEVKGKSGKNGKFPLYITLHGGGGAPSEVNDEQWRQMFSYYKDSVKNGIYIACRGITDTWDLHFQKNSYVLYDRLIKNMIFTHDADPNRVYLLGFSAGGDGVYQILPRMADRFAAGNMSSGHPNGVSLLNLANCPISIQAGIRDYYSRSAMRSVRGAEFEKVLNNYRNFYGFGYEHQVLIHVPYGHNYPDNEGSYKSYVLENPVKFAEKGSEILDDFIFVLSKYEDLSGYDDAMKISELSYYSPHEKEFNDALMNFITKKFSVKQVCPDAVAYVLKFKRNPFPDKIVWDLSTRDGSKYFYWLAADKNVNKGVIQASINKKTNTIKLNPDKNVNGDFSVLISPYMLDVSKPINLITPQGNFSVKINFSEEFAKNSLIERGDPNYIFVGEIRYYR